MTLESNVIVASKNWLDKKIFYFAKFIIDALSAHK